jgi:hypothetical protein
MPLLAHLREKVRRRTQCVVDQHPQTREFMIAGPLVVLADAVSRSIKSSRMRSARMLFIAQF